MTLIYRELISFAHKIWSLIKVNVLKHICSKYPIVKKPNEIFCKVYKVKDDTWEDTYYPECYMHCKEQHLSIFSSAEYIYKVNSGIVSNESDVVITPYGVYWDKFNEEEFLTFASPCDNNVVWYDNSTICVRNYKKKVKVSGKVLSLLGVWAYHWGHCMYQFLPKLFTAGEAGLLNDDFTILIPNNEDSTICDILSIYLEKYPKVKILKTDDGVDYQCEELYFMPSSGSNFNNPRFRLDYPYYISRHVIDKTKKYVIDPLINKIKDNEVKYEKVYLPRRGRRTATNMEEIDEFFKNEGFVELEGAKLSLEEKADIFYHAKEIVGMYGSGLLNLMFCNNANCMVLTNYMMSTDTSLYLQIRDYVSKLINITGRDSMPEYHTNTYYPLDKIINAYNEYIKVN